MPSSAFDVMTVLNPQASGCEEVTGMTRPRKRSIPKAGIQIRSTALKADTLTTKPNRWLAVPSLRHNEDGELVAAAFLAIHHPQCVPGRGCQVAVQADLQLFFADLSASQSCAYNCVNTYVCVNQHSVMHTFTY